jgi:glutamate synthase domain-containing protein 2
MRNFALYFLVVTTIVVLILSSRFHWLLYLLYITIPLVLLGIYDIIQRKHNLLRNYPIVGHFRWIFEHIRPQIHQYLVESNTDGRPFNRDDRTIVYERSKNLASVKPFGTESDVYANDYRWLNHSITPRPYNKELYRVLIGNHQCSQPYNSSVLNISAMSFGSIGAHAIMALNKGAQQGNFAHDTGEGGISEYHKKYAGDLIWEIGTGYFGCRDNKGEFSEDLFAEQANLEQVKMIELKLSQGAKPGKGGMLPKAKISKEIAETRKVPRDVDCISPSNHSAFTTPIEFLEFIDKLRKLSGGKPTGFKLCIGERFEFLAICKAMLKTDIYPDFIVIDGAEGGTGAAPLEFTEHVGTPLREGLLFTHNALVGINAREKIKLGASGQIISGFGMVFNMALGADWCNSARGFMFALGCVQSQKCHTDKCPTGIATQDPKRQRAIVVDEKATRVVNFHHHTVRAMGEMVAAAGLHHPTELCPRNISYRLSPTMIRTADRVFSFLQPGELIEGTDQPGYREFWKMATAESFNPAQDWKETQLKHAPMFHEASF